MKNIFISFLALLATAMGVISCSKEEPSPSPTPVLDEIDYLVMWYAVGGKNLDGGQMSNIQQALDYGSTDKVRMTFEYKLSRTSSLARFQDDARFKNFNGTRRFTTDQNGHIKGTIAKESLKGLLNVDEIENLCNMIKSEYVGDTSYVMASDTALTSFINWSRALYPNAKNLILVLGNHGGGWNLDTDGKYDCTKSIEYDDNIKKGIMMTAKDVEKGIRSSSVQRVKMLYTDACLMSVHENYESYAKVMDYVLSAVEYTPGPGGNYYVFLDALNSTSPDDAGLWNTCKPYIDYLNTAWWDTKEYCDCGIFDLRRNSSLTAVCKSIGDKLVSCWNNETPVTPGGSMQLWKEYIRIAVSRCELCVSGAVIKENYVPDSMKPYLAMENIRPNEDGYYDANEIIDWLLGDSESLQQAREADPTAMHQLQANVTAMSHDEYCLADLLRVLNKSLKEGGCADSDNPFIQLRSEYISKLKEMSYINCTQKTSEPDYAYEHCGPGIFLYTFNSSAWNKSGDKPFKFGDMKLEDAIRYYEASDFDKVTSWSSFLKLNDVSPSLMTNPSRRSYKP